MSDIFFAELNIPRPDINLGVGSGSHTQQTAQVMLGLEQVFIDHKPDCVLVYGDVNSTLAAALVCAKMGIFVGHVEAGLRSRDWAMPEEVNRVVTDQLADVLFTPSRDADTNLTREGIEPGRIRFVGNVMIDTLTRMLPTLDQVILDVPPDYGFVTLHRPSNVDDPAMLHQIMRGLVDISRDIPLMFPLHPRTRQRLAEIAWSVPADANIQLRSPLTYLESLKAQRQARFVITDSGGIQEETTWLQIPCLTLRTTTERPVTIEQGTNRLIGQDIELLKRSIASLLTDPPRSTRKPEYWDGLASQRIAHILVNDHLSKR
jgi:UDP-N-acetylglucosamine 2-epimerase (non-hydrolysing)